MPPRILIHTLGCKVNQADTRELASGLARRGCLVIKGGPADAVVVNTCVVTATAEAKCRQALRGLGRRFPDAQVFAVGCGTRRSDLTISELQGITILPGTDPDELADAIAVRVGAGGPALLPPRGRTRALLAVQTGCLGHCAYCIVPSVRGRPRSLSLKQVLAGVSDLEGQGYREIVLCGTNLGTYGRDLSPSVTLLDLVRQLPVGSELRYRLSSLEPMDVEPELVQLVAGSPGICRHLHLVMQSGSPRVLEAMGRAGSLDRLRSLVRTAREVDPRCAVTTDLIAGFPGETEEDHRATLEAIEEFRFSRVHVFPFSSRPGTEAAVMAGQLPATVRAVRARELSGAGEVQAVRFASEQMGTCCQVLIEREDGQGLSDHYLRVSVIGWRGPANRLTGVRLNGLCGTGVLGMEEEG